MILSQALESNGRARNLLISHFMAVLINRIFGPPLCLANITKITEETRGESYKREDLVTKYFIANRSFFAAQLLFDQLRRKKVQNRMEIIKLRVSITLTEFSMITST